MVIVQYKNRNFVLDKKENIVANMRGETMSNLMLDVDQASELKAAFRRGGWNNAEIKQLSTRDFLVKFHDVLQGFSEIHSIKHPIDLDTTPFLPEGWKGVEEHRKGDIVKLERRGKNLYLDGKKIDLCLSGKQRKGNFSVGIDLRKELTSRPVLNANILDYLLNNVHLIPDSWKGRCIFFWGTIYCDVDDHLCVRCLYWSGGRWGWDYYCLDRHFGDCDPATVSASD